MLKEEFAYNQLKAALDSYSPINERTWSRLKEICHYKRADKKTIIYHAGRIPSSFAFIVYGLMRCYVINSVGHEYNKNFFNEGQFPGSMASLLKNEPSQLEFETIEDSGFIEIDFQGFRRILYQSNDLMLFHIKYLEKNWLLAKDAREIELVQDCATERYKHFIAERPELIHRLPLYHIAAHLGITPTQLSRIRSTFNAPE